MPLHRFQVIYEVDVWHICSCGTAEACNCEPCGYWGKETRSDVLRLWFDYGEPCPGWRPSYSRGYPVPEKVPTAGVEPCLARAAKPRGQHSQTESGSSVSTVGRPAEGRPAELVAGRLDGAARFQNHHHQEKPR